MATIQQLDVYSIVTLVDRLGIGGKDAEFIYDGIRFPFVDAERASALEKTVPQFVAEFLFTTDKHKVWTKPTATAPTAYVNRYAIKACPQKLIDLWGPEVADCTPIERDPDAIEGSDAPLYREPGPVRAVNVNVPMQDLRAGARAGRSAVMGR